MTTPRPLRIVALVVVAVLAACARPAAQPLRARADEHVRGAAILRAGTSGDYPPFSAWVGARAEGFAPELLRGFAAAHATEVVFTRFRWPDLLADVRAARFDVAADGITVRPERSVAGVFTVPIARGGAVLLLRRPAWAPRGASLAQIDRPSLRVGVNRGGHLERVARASLHAAEIRAIADNSAVRDALARGEVDAVMTNTFEAPRWSATVGADLETLGPLSSDVTALWLSLSRSPDRADLAARLDAWLLDEEESGRLGALRARMLGGDGGAAPATAPAVGALLAATEERLSLMPWVAAAKARAGLAVEDAAQEERVVAGAVIAVARAAAAAGREEPPRPCVDAFFRAQIDAAKEVQAEAQAAHAEPAGEDAPTLERDLRPAIARITSRMAWLLVRLWSGGAEVRAAAVRDEAGRDLGRTGVAAPTIDRLAAAICACRAR